MKDNRRVDWHVWGHIRDVKLWEAVAISLDIDPKKVEISSGSWKVGELMFKEETEFQNRLLVAERNLTGGRFHPTAIVANAPNMCTVSLDEFAVWALSIHWELPPVLAEMAKEADTPKPQELLTVEKSLATRERNNAARIIGALAKEAKIDLSNPYSAAKAIEVLTEQYGVRVSQDTIAKWVKEAAAQTEVNGK